MAAAGSALPADLVLDTSVVVAWAFREAARWELARDVIAEVACGAVVAYVPELFWPEFQQACVNKHHRRPQERDALGVPWANVDAAYAAADALPLEEVPVVAELRDDAWLLRRHLEVGGNDAYFLSLARGFGLELWTFDVNLCGLLAVDPALRAMVKHVGVDVTW